MKQLAIILLLFVCSIAAVADTLKGIVQNGTTNKPSAGDEVTLKKIGNGMEDVAKTKSNAKGEFTFNVPPAQQPYLVWVQHQGVTYTQAGMPGNTPVPVRVFDSSSSVKELSILEHAMALQTSPDGTTLSGEEFYTVSNQSVPPRTLSGQRTFEFYLPEGAKISESSVQSGKTQLKATVVPTTEKNRFAFVFPIRPGQTQFHILYTVPYSGKLDINPRSDLKTDALMVVAPDSMKFTAGDSAIYQNTPNPQYKTLNFYLAKNVTAQQKVAFEVSGIGEIPREQEQTTANASGPGEPAGPGGGLGVPNERPDPLHSGQWLFLGVLSLFLAAGAVFVYTSNQNAPMTAGGPAVPKDRSAMLMEAMKEEVFQLESERLQGKITPQDYQAAKAALDKTLQRAVQRQSKPSA